MLTARIAQALSMAVEAHAGQMRKGTTIPYLSHPLAVASIALEFGADEDQAIAALLHDAIEDGGQHYAQLIEDQFGQRVLFLVEGCTDGVPDAGGNKTDWHTRKRSYLKHLEVAHDDILLVSGADKLHNARAITTDLKSVGKIVFERFSTKKDGTIWYYQSLAGIFEKRKVPMAGALNEAVDDMIKLSL
jgi:(p)ppGpp synthase/HD superfamily hydrolase